MAQQTPKYQALLDVLKELFQLDQADLDFGIYRIMNHKREEITTFLEKDLLPQVRSILNEEAGGGQEAVKVELEKLEKTLREAGMEPKDSPKVKELRAQLAAGADTETLENEVFSHLTAFFRRYYHQGDFISMRRYKEGVYAIPYQGEEVKLHWANHDQYYIKSSEHLTQFRFGIGKDKKVEFALLEADRDKDNQKATKGKERKFRLYADAPCEKEGNTLRIRFTYTVPEGTAKKQDEYNQEAVEALRNHVPAAFKAVWDKRPTEKQPERTLLEKRLKDYTARNTFDYFIHKQLGRFLQQELDFYIKNEVLHVDDLHTANPESVLQQVRGIRALKTIAHKLIAFLGQLEDFQKALWLKKKFVTETQYCITLDRVPESLYKTIAANTAQVAEWEQLFHISALKGGKQPNAAFLKDNPCLVLDTGHFYDATTNRNAVKEELLAQLEDLDTQCDGVVVQGDNFQGLGFVQNAYESGLDCIYIDPPYNTGDGDFPYKDNYQHSSWLSMMYDRTIAAQQLIKDSGFFTCSIGREEVFRLDLLFGMLFGEENRLADLVWEKGRKNDAKYFSLGHDYIFAYTLDEDYLKSIGTVLREEKPGAKEILVEYFKLRKEHGTNHNKVQEGIRAFYKALPEEHPALKHKRYNRIDKNGLWRDDNISWPGGGGPRYDVIHPKTGKPCKVPPRGWSFSNIKKFELYVEKGFIEFREDHTDPPMLKRYLNFVDTSFDPEVKTRNSSAKDGEEEANVQVMPSVFYKNSQPTVKELTAIFGEKKFPNPKDPQVVGRLFKYLSGKEGTILDYFAGSGTTAHAVINLNREDENSQRKYLLCEMGQYFDTVLLPRIKKVVYSKDWKEGKPVSREGISHCCKYLRLESYEDTLDNLHLERSAEQQLAMESDAQFKEQYLLGYQLTTEAQGSPSLLDLSAITDPFSYTLRITRHHETVEQRIDLVETFNYLLGLHVRHIDHYKNNTVVVQGHNRAEENVLVIWRNTEKTNNEALNTFFQKMGYSPRDKAFDRIYVNGDNHLANLRTDTDRWKVELIEEAMHRLMFEGVRG